MIVVDASVALAWVLSDTEERLRYSAQVAAAGMAGDKLIAPAVFPAEIAYVLLKKGRGAKWGAAKIAEYAEVIDLFRVELYEAPQSIAARVRFAIRHHVQGYDALYLALAMSTGAILATSDAGMRIAAAVARVKVFVL